MTIPALAHPGWTFLATRWVSSLLVVAIVVFAASLFGIVTRPVGFLAAFWPANAILLGLMVRNPGYASFWTWTTAFIAYMAADLVTGGTLDVTIWLTTANMVGAITGYLLFQLLSEDDRRLRRPLSVLYLFAICAAAALAAAFAGGGAARVLFGRDFRTGLEFWFITELVNSLVILPVMLTFPSMRQLVFRPMRGNDLSAWNLKQVAPVLALAVSCGVATLMGGPGAIVFPVPALIWCALTYSMFTTAVFTMLLCAWLLISISAGLLMLPMSLDTIQSTSSIRLGVALIALGPLTVASINITRNDLLAKLLHATNHDTLTGTLSRGAFMSKGQAMVSELARINGSIALLMLDVDHFKRVNDQYGHAVGDRVLVEFARLAAGVLRPTDLLARLGGEEFAAILPGASLGEAIIVAERIRTTIESSIVEISTGAPVCISVSIGVAATNGPGAVDLGQLLAASEIGRAHV